MWHFVCMFGNLDFLDVDMPSSGALSQERSYWIGRDKVVEISPRNAREKVVPLGLAQENKSEGSRDAILEAALRLFSTRSYRGASIREIAVEAGVSTGCLYYHFPDKVTLFRSLLDQFWELIGAPESPFNKALAEGAFPHDLEALARAAEASVRIHRQHLNLIYVDAVEFEGTHLRKYFSDMPDRFNALLSHRYPGDTLQDLLVPGCSPNTAVLLACRIFLHYFAVEILFGVPGPFGMNTSSSITETAEILRRGVLRSTVAEQLNPCACN